MIRILKVYFLLVIATHQKLNSFLHGFYDVISILLDEVHQVLLTLNLFLNSHDFRVLKVEHFLNLGSIWNIFLVKHSGGISLDYHLLDLLLFSYDLNVTLNDILGFLFSFWLTGQLWLNYLCIFRLLVKVKVNLIIVQLVDVFYEVKEPLLLDIATIILIVLRE